jgi:hypothetical protein
MKRIAAVMAFCLALGALQQAWGIGSSQRLVPDPTAKPLSADEAKKIEAYLRQVLGNSRIRLVHVPPDAEVYLEDQFLGFLYPDNDKEGRTFYFEIPIFQNEIEESPPPIRLR